MIGQDAYYSRTEVSNSDLSLLHDYFCPVEQQTDLQAAYRFGNLIDAMITEPSRCNHLNHTVKSVDTNEWIQFTDQEWKIAYAMLQSFRKDPLCMQFLNNGNGQHVFTEELDIEYGNMQFKLIARGKYDLFVPSFGYGCDIKSTTATSQSQFENTIDYFDYDRQRAWYMDLSRSDRDLLIGISKIPPHRIFKVPIRRGDKLYNSGKAKYQEIAFRYWYLFDGFSNMAA